VAVPEVIYPRNEITPAGWSILARGDSPLIWLDSHDGRMRFYLHGGLEIPDPFASPECVHIDRDGLRGLIPTWEHIDTKGATQDGVTLVDSLYNPAEIELQAVCRGRNGRKTAEVMRALVGSLDAQKMSRLNFYTRDLGHWWTDVHWFQGPPNIPFTMPPGQTIHRLPLRLRATTSFWTSYPHTTMFRMAYAQMADYFDTDYSASQNLGPNWPQTYSGSGGGYHTTKKGRAVWVDVPPYNGREVVNGPYKDFETETNNQVVDIKLATLLEWTFPDGAEVHIWGRMDRNPDGTWGGSGIKAQVGLFQVQLSRYNDFSETVMKKSGITFPPMPDEHWTLVCGESGNERIYKVLRNGHPVLTHRETDNGSDLGPNYRGVGFGVRAGAALITQATPAQIHNVTAGDNATVTQTGWLECVNIGDQPMYMDYTLFGPGTFKIYDGPLSDEYVEIGPILKDQIWFVRTDPRSNTTLIQDLSVVPQTPQELNFWQKAWSNFLSFAGIGQGKLGEQLRSLAHIRPPQGPPYKYMNGRFSKNAAIPPKPSTGRATPYYVKCEIVDGNADSKIVASGDPKLRMPI
jgi:hypothetical protein